MAEDEMRLFGREHDEHLVDDLAAAVEAVLDDYGLDDNEVPEDGLPDICEWNVQPARGVIMDAGTLIETVDEMAEDAHGGDDCPFEGAHSDPEVLAAANAFLDAFAATCSWHWAKDIVARHKLTIVDGELHVDGEQFYKTKETK